MPAIINTNIASLNAQRNLSTSQSSLATALQRLSSGLRINSAKDDAAGLAISDRFTTQIRGLNQAARNANDAISLSQTAESALGEVTNNLQRIRELAVQSANSTNSASDRAALDLEVQQRIAEIDRISSQTAFNGLKVLDGTFGSSQFQVGANSGETITVNLSTSMRASQIGAFVNSAGTANFSFTAPAQAAAVVTLNTAGATASTIAEGAAGNLYQGVNSAATGSTLIINGTTVADSANNTGTNAAQSSDSAYAKAAAINSTAITGSVRATATTGITMAANATGTAGDFLRVQADNTGASLTYSLSINNTAVMSVSSTTGTGQIRSIDQAVTAINQFSSATGVTASKDNSGNLVLTAADGRNINISETYAASAGTGGGTTDFRSVFSRAVSNGNDTTIASFTSSETFRGQVSLQSTNSISITSGGATIGQAATATIAASGNVAAINVTSVSNANNAILGVDAALTAVSNLRSTFGAIQNRFESTIANLSAVSENLEASRSRILDADFAAETAALTRSQILQQAGIAILAQANAVPQNVLGLLQ